MDIKFQDNSVGLKPNLHSTQLIEMAQNTNKNLVGDVTQTNNIYVTNDETGQKIGSKVKDMSYMALRYQLGTVR